MSHQTRNRYCTRCGRTTLFFIEKEVYTCTGCGVRVEPAQRPAESRALVGDPFHNFRVGFG